MQLPKMGIKLLPVDVNESYGDFTPVGNNIRYGMAAVKNVGRNFVANIIKNRGGGYTTLRDFCIKNTDDGINKRALEYLIKAGAFDSVGKGFRSQYLACYEQVVDETSSSSRYNFSGQVSFLGEDDMVEDDLPNVKPFTKEYTLRVEKEAMGVYLSGHPLDEYFNAIEKSSTATVADIINSFDGSGEGGVKDGQEVKIAGLVTSYKTKFTKTNSRMAFVEFEDLTGSIELVVFPATFSTYEKLISEGSKVCVSGKVDGDDESVPKILVDSIRELRMTSDKKAYIKIPVGMEDRMDMVKELLKIYSGDVPVYLYVEAENKYYAANRDLWIEPAPALEKHLKRNFGEDCQLIVK